MINKSVIHDYALKCSKELRAGKFTRVGQQFIDSVEEDLEGIIRATCPGSPPDRLPTVDGSKLFIVEAKVLPRLSEKLNKAVQCVVARKVMRHPSVGVTLQRP
jgi:hypothetical protein